MAISWGAWRNDSTGNGLRVGIAVSWTRVTNGSGSVRASVKVYVQDRYWYADNQQLNYSGSISGTKAFYNNWGHRKNEYRLVDTKSYTYTYPASSYGRSPGKVSFGARLSGVASGLAPSVTVSVAIPTRPIAAPAAPTANKAGWSGSNIVQSWTNHSTNARPYGSLQVQYGYWDANGPFSDYAGTKNLSGKATSYNWGSGAENRRYRYRVRARNAAGYSAWAYMDTDPGVIYQTPAAPTGLRAALKANGTITLTWTPHSYSAQTGGLTIQRLEGSSWTTVIFDLGWQSTTWTDSSPLPGSNQYRIRAVHRPQAYDSGRTLTSDWNTSNTVSTIVPPLAPTELDPNGVIRNAEFGGVTLYWHHNDGGDGADQSAVNLRYRLAGTNDDWTNYPTITTTEPYTIIPPGVFTNGNAYQWQVATQGIPSGGFGPYSATATLYAYTQPVVTVTEPTDGEVLATSHLHVEWDFQQAEGQVQTAWAAYLWDQPVAGNTIIAQESGTGWDTREVDFDYQLEDGHEYTVWVLVESVQQSHAAGVTFTTDFPLPNPVTTDVDYFECSGAMSLHITEDTSGADPSLRDATNLAINPNLAEDLTGYTAGGGASITRDTSDVLDPTGCLKITGSTNTDNRADLQAGPSNTTQELEPGHTYTLSAEGVLGAEWSGSQHERARCLWATVKAPSLEGGVQQTYISEPITSTTEPQRVSVTFPVPEDATVYTLRLYNGSNSAADAIYWDKILVKEGDDSDIEFFDGDTERTGEFRYEWTGTPNASTSRRIGKDPVTAKSVDVQRSADGGETWVTLADQLNLTADLVDPLPNSVGSTLYRVTVHSDVPSIRRMDDFAVLTPTGEIVDPDDMPEFLDYAADEHEWIFLSWGNSFENLLRFHGNPEWSETVGRTAEAQPLLGGDYPVALFGVGKSRVLKLSGTLEYAPYDCPPESVDPCRYDSPPEDWRQARHEASIVCLRTYEGHRVFGMLSSDIDLGKGDRPGLATLDFEVTRTRYTETYEPLTDLPPDDGGDDGDDGGDDGDHDPNLVITDSFDRADANTLGEADTGQEWITPPDIDGSTGQAWAIRDNQAACTALSPGGQGHALQEMHVPDHQMQVKLSVAPSGASIGGIVRASGAGDGYAATQVGIYKRADGESINPALAAFSTRFEEGDTMRINARGNVITVYRQAAGSEDNPFTQVGTFTDASYSSNTMCGIRCAAQGTSSRFDDFRAEVF